MANTNRSSDLLIGNGPNLHGDFLTPAFWDSARLPLKKMKEILPEKLLSLPIVELRAEIKNSQMIKGDEGNVHYEITKVRVLPRSKIIIYSLSTSGPEEERREFVKQIIETLGEPFNTEQEFADIPDYYFNFWEANKVEQRLETRKIMERSNRITVAWQKLTASEKQYDTYNKMSSAATEKLIEKIREGKPSEEGMEYIYGYLRAVENFKSR